MALIPKPTRTDSQGNTQPGRQTHMVSPARGDEPHPTPGYQDFFTRRFELSLSLIKRHSALASRRAMTALLLVLASLLLITIDLWLIFNLPPPGGIFFWFLRLIIFLLLLGAWLCAMICAGFALGANLWKIYPGIQASEIFFQSGGSALSDEADFVRRFRESSQAQMLAGALHELYQQALFRQRQERWLRYAILFFAIALLGLSVSALLAIIL